MAASIKKLLEERAELIGKARQINDQHCDADGHLPAEYQEQYDKAMADAQVKADAVKRLRELDAADESLKGFAEAGATPPNPGATAKGGDGASEFILIRSGRDDKGEPKYEKVPIGKRGQSDYRQALAKALAGQGLSAEQFAALRSDDAEQAGYLVASEQLAAGILKAVDDMVFVRRLAKVHTVREADTLGIRKRTSKANTFDWTAELALADEDTSLAYGKKILTPRHLTGEIKVSRDLVRRSMEGIESIVREEMARDAGETMEQAYLTGDGHMKPLGVFVASSDGISTSRDSNTGSTSGFTPDGLVAAKYKLKQQYRNGGSRSGARWMFHRDAIKLISQLKDGDDHYLLHPGRGLTGDEWDTLLGYPVDESEFCPNTFQDGLYGGILANWQYYEIADALDLEIQVLTELYSRTNQIGYIGRLKTDGLPTLEEAFVRLKCAT